MIYGLIIWYREKGDEEVKRYAALVTDLKSCLDLIKKYAKEHVLVTTTIENQSEVD